MERQYKEELIMILFTMLVLALLMLATIGIILTGASCLAFITVYGDVIICVAVIVLIIRFFVKRRKK